MKTNLKVGIGVLSLIALTLSFFGGVNLTDDNVYYCEDRQVIMQCDKLSGYYSLENGKCWNSNIGNKLCKTGWLEITQDIQVEIDTSTKSGVQQYICSAPPELGCVKLGE